MANRNELFVRLFSSFRIFIHQQFAASFIGMTRSTAPVAWQIICHGTMLE
jgi:hypothetical protein